MRILYVIPHFFPSLSFGGTPVVCQQLAKEMVRKGHQVTILTTDVFDKHSRVSKNLRRENSPEGYQIIRLANISNYLAFRFKISTPPELVSFLALNLRNYDLVHLHEYRTIFNPLVCLLSRNQKQKIIIQPHGTIYNYETRVKAKSIFDRIFNNIIINRTNNFLALSLVEKRQLQKIGVAKSKIIILPNGVSIDRSTKAQDLPRKFILYFGRVERRKGIDTLIQAYSRSKFPQNNVCLVIAGGDDGHLSVCQKLATDLHLQRKIIFIGQVSPEHRNSLFSKAHLLVYVTKREVFGLSPLEAASVGLWPIVSRDSGVATVLRKFKIGDEIKYLDINQLVMTLNKYISKKPKVPKSIQKQIKSEFSWKSLATKLESVYQKL